MFNVKISVNYNIALKKKFHFLCLKIYIRNFGDFSFMSGCESGVQISKSQWQNQSHSCNMPWISERVYYFVYRRTAYLAPQLGVIHLPLPMDSRLACIFLLPTTIPYLGLVEYLRSCWHALGARMSSVIVRMRAVYAKIMDVMKYWICFHWWTDLRQFLKLYAIDPAVSKLSELFKSYISVRF